MSNLINCEAAITQGRKTTLLMETNVGHSIPQPPISRGRELRTFLIRHLLLRTNRCCPSGRQTFRVTLVTKIPPLPDLLRTRNPFPQKKDVRRVEICSKMAETFVNFVSTLMRFWVVLAMSSTQFDIDS